MRERADISASGPLRVQALYSIQVLARAANVSSDLLRRLLRVRRVEFVRAGRFIYVPLVEIEDKLPMLWRSIQVAESLRRK